ncbi:MAG: hypothetical protein ACYTBJ_18350 [Planctomycetota bacterium]|jgi:transcriptional regulator with XRE-family HTH domain
MGCQQGELEDKLERIRRAVPEALRWLEGIDATLGPPMDGARWTQSDLARALGTTQQMISANERPGRVNSFASGAALLGLAVAEGHLELAEAALDGTEYCLILKNELREPRGDLAAELGTLSMQMGETLRDGLEALRDGRIDPRERRVLETDVRKLFEVLEEIETVLELKPSPSNKKSTAKRRR